MHCSELKIIPSKRTIGMTVGFVFLSSDSFIYNSEILPLILNSEILSAIIKKFRK